MRVREQLRQAILAIEAARLEEGWDAPATYAAFARAVRLAETDLARHPPKEQPPTP